MSWRTGRATSFSYPPNLYGSVHGTTASTVSFTAAKLALETTSADKPAVVVSLVTAPGVVKNADGSVQQVLSVTDAKYDGISIEHQISDVPGIEDYNASSWLGFVEASAGSALSSRLGDFDVPLVLRSFPTTPAMTDQRGQSHPDTTDLATLLDGPASSPIRSTSIIRMIAFTPTSFSTLRKAACALWWLMPLVRLPNS